MSALLFLKNFLCCNHGSPRHSISKKRANNCDLPSFSLKFVQCVSALRYVHIGCVGYQTDSLHLCQCEIPPCLLLLISLGKRSMNKNTTRLFRETLLASPHALVVTQVGWKEGDWEYLIGIPNGWLQARIGQVKEEDRLKG